MSGAACTCPIPTPQSIAVEATSKIDYVKKLEQQGYLKSKTDTSGLSAQEKAFLGIEDAPAPKVKLAEPSKLSDAEKAFLGIEDDPKPRLSSKTNTAALSPQEKAFLGIEDAPPIAPAAPPAGKAKSLQEFFYGSKPKPAAPAPSGAQVAATKKAATDTATAAQDAALKRSVERQVREFARQDEGRRYGHEVWSGPEAYSPAELNALRDYTGDGYSRINGRLRSSAGEKTNPAIRQMDKAMDKAPRVPEDLKVTRNADARSFGLPPGADLSKLEGAEFTEHGFLSTSLNSKGAMSGDVRLNLIVPKGHKAVYVSGKPPQGKGKTISSVGGGEAELILQRGSKYRILGVRRVGKRWVVDAEVIAA